MFSRNFRNSVLAGNKGTNMAYFGHVSGSRTLCVHDFAMKYITANWAVMGGMLKLLI